MTNWRAWSAFQARQAAEPREWRPGQLHPLAASLNNVPWQDLPLASFLPLRREGAHKPLLLFSSGCQSDALHSAPKEVPTRKSAQGNEKMKQCVTVSNYCIKTTYGNFIVHFIPQHVPSSHTSLTQSLSRAFGPDLLQKRGWFKNVLDRIIVFKKFFKTSWSLRGFHNLALFSIWVCCCCCCILIS